MKKVLSVMLAALMLCALCVPAFAADNITKTTDQSAQVNVKTSTETKDGQDPTNYTVTIPADVTIPWGDSESKTLAYTVDTQLKVGASLKVKAEAQNGGEMTATGTTEKLTFTLANGDESTFGIYEKGATPVAQPSVSIADFTAAPIAEYTGTVLFTVTYTPAD